VRVGEAPVSRRSWYFSALLVPLLALQFFSLAYYVREQGALTQYVNHVADASSPPSEQVKAIVLSLKDKQGNTTNSYFLCPLFRFLRPTPWQVVKLGGDCADRSRLVIALLRLRRIHASKWALYNAQGESKHAVIEADVESGRMVADPLFGLWFPRPSGGYYTIAEMKKDPNILLQRIAQLRSQGSDPGAAPLKFYEFDQYVYSDARTINWNKPVLGTFFRVLHFLLGERTNQISRPSFVEEPPLMLIYGIAGLELCILLAWFLLVRRRGSGSSAKFPV